MVWRLFGFKLGGYWNDFFGSWGAGGEGRKRNEGGLRNIKIKFLIFLGVFYFVLYLDLDF